MILITLLLSPLPPGARMMMVMVVVMVTMMTGTTATTTYTVTYKSQMLLHSCITVAGQTENN